MKAKIVLLADNDKQLSVYGNRPEESIKEAWELFLTMVNCQGQVHVKVDTVEILEDADA